MKPLVAHGLSEVENIEAFQTFNREYLGGAYPYVVLVEGNDPRPVDVGVLSKLPIGRIVSHQTEPDPVRPPALASLAHLHLPR